MVARYQVEWQDKSRGAVEDGLIIKTRRKLMKSAWRLTLALIITVALAACKSTPEPEAVPEQEPVDETPVVETQAAPDPRDYTDSRNFDNPESLLSKRVIYFDFDKSTVRPEFRGIVAAHAAYAASSNTARMTLATDGFDQGLSAHGRTPTPAVRLTGLLLAAHDLLRDYDDLLATRWREHAYLQALLRLAAGFRHQIPLAARGALLQPAGQRDQLAHRKAGFPGIAARLVDFAVHVNVAVAGHRHADLALHPRDFHPCRQPADRRPGGHSLQLHAPRPGRAVRTRKLESGREGRAVGLHRLHQPFRAQSGDAVFRSRPLAQAAHRALRGDPCPLHR